MKLNLPPRGIMPSRIGMPLPPPLIPPIMGRRRAIDTLILWPWNSLPVEKCRRKGAFYSSTKEFQIYFGIFVKIHFVASHTIKMFHSCFGTDWLFVGQGGNSFGFSSLIVLVYVNGRLAKSAVHLGQHTHTHNTVSSMTLDLQVCLVAVKSPLPWWARRVWRTQPSPPGWPCQSTLWCRLCCSQSRPALLDVLQAEHKFQFVKYINVSSQPLFIGPFTWIL